MVSRFYEEIKNSTIERQVEDVYNKGITMYFIKDKNIALEYPYGCDGVLTVDMFLKLLIEYKYNEELINPVSRAKVLVQVLYYLKRFEENGDRLPNIIMVGDINEVFVINADDHFTNYLDENIDWSISPSTAHEKNPDLVLKIANDGKINPFVWTVDKNFSFLDVANRIKELATNNPRHVRITEHNISKIFDYFTSKVIKDSNKISPNDLVSIFISSIIDKNNCYKHPNNQNILVSNNKQIQINGRNFDSFFSYFEKEYTPQEKNKFTEISDRLIEDTKRRRSGEFYTPTLFTDYAHKMLSEQLGQDWKEKYVVWDCCWGTGNLTRDYEFKELYASTLEQAELDCGQRYNPEATKFVFDFLNDEITDLFGSKLPPKLYEALDQNRPILFFLNPPYATAGINNETSKKGCAKTRINKKMLNDGIGACSQNLYAQFLYRILLIKKHFNLSNLKIGVFCPTLFLTGGTYRKFRNEFLSNFNLKDAIQFSASYFADVASYWGIGFTIWDVGCTNNINYFKYKIVEEHENEIKIINNKTIYNLDNQKTLKDWAKDKNAKNDIQIVCLKSAINPASRIKKYYSESLGVLVADSNNIDKNMQYVCILNSNIPSNLGILYITKDNFYKCMAICSARKLVFGNWINSKDEYCYPDENHPKFKEYLYDSVIFSLFHSGAGQASCQTSLKNIECKGQIYNIKNEFFFMSRNEIMALANENNFDFTYNDARVSEERFVYKKLQEIQLSKEAQDVLDFAIRLTKKSFKYREMFNQEHPEYQIMNWDCGWYQIKAVLKEYYSNDLREFQNLYKILADKMRPMVYELGFLR